MLGYGALSLGLVALVGGGVFLYLFPWVLDNRASEGVAGPEIPVVSLVAPAGGAQETYAHTCSYCHDQGVGPDLHGTALNAEQITILVRSGFGAMPSFRASDIPDERLAELTQAIAAHELTGEAE